MAEAEDDRTGVNRYNDEYMRSRARDIVKAQQIMEFCRDNGLLTENYDEFGEENRDKLLLQGIRETIAAFLHLARELGADPLDELTLALVYLIKEESCIAAEVDLTEAQLLNRPLTDQVWRRGTALIMVHMDDAEEPDGQHIWLTQKQESVLAHITGFRKWFTNPDRPKHLGSHGPVEGIQAAVAAARHGVQIATGHADG
jgi:hypothetical protein